MELSDLMGILRVENWILSPRSVDGRESLLPKKSSSLCRWSLRYIGSAAMLQLATGENGVVDSLHRESSKE